MKENLKDTDYYIGLDCGTSSVGFAVTDTSYNVLKFNGKRMWGAHLFDEASTAKGRRGFRTSRRRLERRKKRISLLQEIFAEEIYKVDPTFFIRLNDSKYVLEDKTNPDMNILFNDSGFKDKDFFKVYPTIYHLRKALRTEDIKDPRLLYLGIQHILKHRGHFLFPGENMSGVLTIEPLIEKITELFSEIFTDITFEYTNIFDIEKALQEKTSSLKKERLNEAIIIADKKLKTALIKMITGYKTKTKEFFNKEDDIDIPDIEFKKVSFEETDLPKLEESLSDDEFSFVKAVKGVYDWSLLVSILKGQAYISDAKIKLYENNKLDILHLKKAIKTYASDKYENFFHSDEDGSYSRYTGKIHDNRKHEKVKRSNTDDFYKKIRTLLDKAPKENEDVHYVLSAIENDSFLPLLSSFRNGTIPWQVNNAELIAILNNSAKNFAFLSQPDKDGFTAETKIKELLKFRVPYYVGPLGANPDGKGTKGKNSWVERKTNGRVLPWNFNQKVDAEVSAENFIGRMTNKCTYCKDQDVLPKNSITYSKYMVLNELNNLRICGDRLSVERKQEIFNNLYKKTKKVTVKGIINYAVKEGWYAKGEITKDDISGIGLEIKASMASYIDFKDYIDNGKLRNNDAEKIIKWITVFSEGGPVLKDRISREYGNVLSMEDIEKISKLHYAGWGRFSKKFLCELKGINKQTGEILSIMGMLWETQHNLMELLSDNYEFVEQIDKPTSLSHLDYSTVEDMYTSPAVKKQTWQALRIVNELKKIIGHNPKKIFIEVTRSEQEKKRTRSRKQTILDALEDAKKTNPEYKEELQNLIKELSEKSENDVARQDKLYLYFSQQGKCMYSGERINLEDLYKTNIYDIDHIYPRSKSNDDSLTNRVLVSKTVNARKSNDYPIDDTIRNKMSKQWKFLYEKGFIPKEKYNRLTRNSPLTDEDLKGFINRQLVETSQTVKQVATILKSLFGDDTKVVYSKAGNVSDFRHDHNFIKCRSMNDLHHAKDAYLNIVVGNVFDTKYTADFYKSANGIGYGNLSTPFDYDVRGAWKAGNQGTILTVRKTMNKNDILFTRQPVTRKGQLFNVQIVKKGTFKGVLATKSSDEKLKALVDKKGNHASTYDEWTAKYGGYNSLATSHFAVVKHEEKGKPFVSFIAISMIDAKRLENPDALLQYCTNTLGLINPSIVRTKLLINTQLKIDGYLFALAGSSNRGAVITVNNNIPLILSNSSEETLKSIDNFFNKNENNKEAKPNPLFDKITDENTESLFLELIEKNENKLYLQRPGNQKKVLNNGALIKFRELTLLDRCNVVREIIKYYGMSNGLANFTLIGGSKACGTLTKSAKQDLSKSEISLYDQSITGLFETIEEIKA